MPIFDIECKTCGEISRDLITTKFKDLRCPTCGCDNLRQIYGPVTLVFKGEGFYATDYKNK